MGGGPSLVMLLVVCTPSLLTSLVVTIPSLVTSLVVMTPSLVTVPCESWSYSGSGRESSNPECLGSDS